MQRYKIKGQVYEKKGIQRIKQQNGYTVAYQRHQCDTKLLGHIYLVNGHILFVL